MTVGVVLCIVLSMLLGQASASAGYVPVFEPGPCPVRFAAPAECGTVIVPQDRANPQGAVVRLAVAVFKASGPEAAVDPLIFLDGGPGGRTLDTYVTGLGDFLRRLNRQHDVILFDYRGMGYSDPALTCPESVDPAATDWVTTCRQRLAEQGVDVTFYTTRDNATDADDIIRALGYESYNIWGGSYGSSVAMTLLRDHPERIRAAIVTALQPPQGDLESGIPVYFQRSLSAISDLCQADSACASAFPFDLVEALAVVVERLNANPLPVVVHGVEQLITGNDVANGVGQLMKDHANIPIIPGFIATLYAEQYGIIETYANNLTPRPDPLNPIGAYLSMRCTDSILVVSEVTYDAALQTIHPAFREGFKQRHEFSAGQCLDWGARIPTAADAAPAITDTPVLIISGALDPFSSQEWLDSTLATLPNGRGFMLPYHLHYVTQHPCALQLLVNFIDDPQADLDASCMDKVLPPSFKTN
jgi:pimeloyl-ACP methyl ester carboxylesterase